MRQGYLREGDTTLWVDAHQLLHWLLEHLSRVKKIVSITMSLGLASTIRFNIWDQVGDLGKFEMVLQDLFDKQFARYNMTNPHGVQLESLIDYRCRAHKDYMETK